MSPADDDSRYEIARKSERALRPGVVLCKLARGPRSHQGAEFFATARLAIGTGGLNNLSPIEAIARTIDGQAILAPWQSSHFAVAGPRDWGLG